MKWPSVFSGTFLLPFGRESIPSGVQDPGVVVGALHTSEETDGLSRQLPGRQRTCVGQRTVGLSLDVTFLFPFLEVSQRGQFCWILHPLDNLEREDTY